MHAEGGETRGSARAWSSSRHHSHGTCSSDPPYHRAPSPLPRSAPVPTNDALYSSILQILPQILTSAKENPPKDSPKVPRSPAEEGTRRGCSSPPSLRGRRPRSRPARSVHHLPVSIGQHFHQTQNIYFSKTIANDNGYILSPQQGFNISNTYTPNTVQYCTKRKKKKKDVPPYCTELYIQSTILHSLIYTPYIYWCRRHETMETVLARTFHPTIKQLLLIKPQPPTRRPSPSPLSQD